VRWLPGLKGQNSVFRLPEHYDDLLNEWTHDKHIVERNSALGGLQKLAADHKMRVTFLSGDVHCAAFPRLCSDETIRKLEALSPETDSKLMYQVIASAIVNQAPSPKVCIACLYLQTK
jgi:PhoD related phosphatase